MLAALKFRRRFGLVKPPIDIPPDVSSSPRLVKLIPLTLLSPVRALCFFPALNRDPKPDLSFSKLGLAMAALFRVAKMLICSSPLDSSSDI